MTIAEQVAHDFLDSVEKNIVANKLDIKSLETNTYYQSKDEVKMEVADKKTGVVIATMKCNFDTSRIKKEIKKQMIEDYCNGNICDSCEFCNDCEKEMVFSEIVDEKLKDYVSRIDEKNTDKESQNECELEEKKMEQVKVLKKATKIYYPDEMKDVLPLKEFVKNITDKGYKVELTKDNVVSDTVVNIYKEVEIKE